MAAHETILQTLDREINGHFFNTDAFRGSVTDWNGIPLVYANNHPDMETFTNDQAAALTAIDGIIVGTVENAHIAMDGHPRLMGNLINTDEDVEELIKSGKASISTGFKGFSSKNEVTEVIPNHVLIFKEDINNMPKDKGAFILNKTDFYGHNIDTEAQNMEDTKELSKAIAIANKQIGDITSKLDIANKENDTLKAEVTGRDGLLEVANKTLTERDTSITEMTETIKTQKETLEEYAQKEVDALTKKREDQWTTIKAGIPVGLTHKEDDEKALRTEWETDPHTFSVKMLEFKQKEGTGESGDMYTQKDIDSTTKVLDELGIPSIEMVGGN